MFLQKVGNPGAFRQVYFWLATALAILFWAFFFLLPFFAFSKILAETTASNKILYFWELLQNNNYLSVVWFTFKQAFLSAFFSLLLGIPTSFLFVRFRFPFQNQFYFLFIFPFVMPTILVVLCIIQFWGYQGYLNLILKKIFSLFFLPVPESPLRVLYSLKGIIIAHVFFNLPVVLQIVGSTWSRISQKYNKAARLLGCSELKSLYRIDLPILLPAISSAFILIFILCMNSFAIVWVLGGGKNPIIETLIYELARIHLDYEAVLGLVGLQIFLGLVVVGIFYRHSSTKIIAEPFAGQSFVSFFQKNKIKGSLIVFFFCFVAFVVLGPLVSLVIDSFRVADGFSLQWWIFFFQKGWQTLLPVFWTSLQIALGSACLSFVLLLLVAPVFYKYPSKRKWLELLFLTPLSISSITLGLGWFLFYQDFAYQYFWAEKKIALVFYAICIHSIIFFPYWLRLLLPSLELIPKNWFMLKRLHAYPPFLFAWKVLLPWIKKPFCRTFLLVLALSFGELNILLLIADTDFKTLTTEIFSAIAAYRFSYASLIGVLFMFFFFVLGFLIHLLGRRVD